jgi:hypothetical protein
MSGKKSSKFFETFMSEATKAAGMEAVYVARVLRKLGNGRLEVFFMDAKDRPKTEHALIRGSFRGRGKSQAWIDVNSIVIISETGVGSAKYLVVSVLDPDQIRALRKDMTLDPRIFASDNTDKESLLKGGGDDMGGFVFDGEDDGKELNDADIDDI